MSDEPNIRSPHDGDKNAAARPVITDPRIGQIIARKYRVLDRIARGGMARIYKAEQQPLGRIVALKELITSRDRGETDPQFLQRFFLEASTLSKLSHPNTVRVFDYGQHDDGSFYMVMEYVQGRTLSRAIRDEGPIQPLRALNIAIEIMRSLQEAHRHSIVHRDLKPSNVMLAETDEGETVKVLDFGIAKVMQENADAITMDDRIVGSPRYMAPEQIRNGEVDHRTDIYALGVLMYELLVGQPPFSGGKTLDTLMAHLNDPIPSVREHSPFELPPVLDELITACLAKKPEDRPQSVADLRDALRGVLIEIAESSPTASRLTTESLIRQALDRRDRTDTGLESPAGWSQPTLNRPQQQEKRRSRLLFFLLPVLLLFVVLVGAFVLILGTDQPADGTASTSSEPPTQEPQAAATSPVPLHLTSVPPGAEVWEGNRMHGITPLELQLHPDAGEREFQLKLAGFEPYVLTQGASDAPVELRADLIPVPPEPVVAPRPKPRPRPKPEPRSEDLDILFER